MAERLGRGLRRTGMRMWLLGSLSAVVVALAGCGDTGSANGSHTETSPTPSTSWCRGDAPEVELVRADLDGDGVADKVSAAPASGDCPGALSASVPDMESRPTLEWEPRPNAHDAFAVALQSRKGDVVVLLERHPRGGFQAHLFGYADGRLEELTVDGSPVFPFVATDALNDPISARCVDGGFEVIRARRHEPIGVVPAWDVDRTTYSIDGNTVTRGATTEIADNVLEKAFHRQYQGLVDYSLFADCRADG